MRLVAISLIFSLLFSQENIISYKDVKVAIEEKIIQNIISSYTYDESKIKSVFQGKRVLSNAPDLYDKVKQSVVLIMTTNGLSGSGSIVDKDGYIITNFHVVENQNDKTLKVVKFNDSIKSVKSVNKLNIEDVEIIGVDPTKDLALLKIKKHNSLKPIEFGKHYAIRIADDVFAVGHPNGYLWYYTSGTINRVAPSEWNYGSSYSVSANTIFTQTPINPGNSGGPLLDNDGKMIGVNSASDPFMDNVYLSVRIDEVEKFIDNAKSGKLDVNTQTLTFDGWIGVDDKNNNGQSDIFLREITLDDGRVVAQWGPDQNEDGIMDYIVCDTNGDDKADLIMKDPDGDGNYNMWSIDKDFDGKIDTEIDTDKS